VHVTVSELKSVMDDDDAVVVDVREPNEYDAGHVPGASLMPLAMVPLKHSELPRDKTIYLICQTGGRSFTAASWLAQQGYDVRNVTGGTSDWVSHGFQVANGRNG
jgi:rhodanese-related sulfurtransferase